MISPIFLIAVPLGMAFSIPLLGFVSKKIVKYIPPIAMFFNLAVSCILITVVERGPIIVSLGGFFPPLGINLFVGPVSILFSCVISLVGFVVSIYALDYIESTRVSGHRSAREAAEKYHMLYLLLLTGATGVVLTGDIFNLFVFFEILCISSYALVAYSGNRAGVESASKYLIQGSVGSAFVLIGIALVYRQFGTLNMADIARNIHSISSIRMFVPLALFVAGFGVEAAVFPLNAWLPDAHACAPSTISAVLSGIAIEVGLYAIARVVFTIFGAQSILLFFVLLGIVTLLLGELSAFSQNNVKRMLAYSSIGQIGLILFALGIGTKYGIEAGLFQFVTHAFSKALLFLSAGYMIYRAGSMDISAFKGMGRRMPLTSLAFTVGAFSLVGLPPFMGFPSKFMIICSALAKGSVMYIVFIGAALLGTVIEGAYFFKVIQVIYFRSAPARQYTSAPEHKSARAPVVALIPIILLAVLIIVVGIYPKIATGVLNSAAQELLNRGGYIRNVLGRI